MIRGVFISAAVAACSSATPAAEAPSAPEPRALLVLYADTAEVRARVDVREDGPVPLAGLPPGARYTMRSIRGDAAAGAQIVGPPPRPTRAGLRDMEVVASRGDRRIAGVVTEVETSEIQLQTDSGIESLPLPVELERPTASTGATVELRPRPGARGELEVSSWLRAIHWEVGYTAVVDGGRARLVGWLSINNASDRDLEVDDVVVTIAAPTARGETGAHRIGRPLSVAAGATVELPLMAPIDLDAAIVEVHDPIRDRLDHEGRRPVARPTYGATPGTDAMPLEVALALDRRRVGALPEGTISVWRRRGAAMVAVGEGDGFSPAAPASEPLEPDPPQLEALESKIVIGRSRRLLGRRWQEEFHHDPVRRRLIEEIRVELENRGDRPVVVDVREHLYRGLNWAIVYHNQAGPLVKTGSQEIRFAVEVAAGSTRLVAYRVAYTW